MSDFVCHGSSVFTKVKINDPITGEKYKINFISQNKYSRPHRATITLANKRLFKVRNESIQWVGIESISNKMINNFNQEEIPRLIEVKKSSPSNDKTPYHLIITFFPYQVRDNTSFLIEENNFPWIAPMRKQYQQLSSDLMNEPNLIEINGRNPVDEPGPLRNLLYSVLNKTDKVVGIFGNDKSSRTIFMKNQVKILLEQYQLNHSLPFYINLAQIKKVGTNLMEESLDLLEIKDPEQRKMLKTINTIWFFDDFDATINEERQTNIYRRNNLSEWKARFVFSASLYAFRAGDERRDFGTDKKEVEVLYIVQP